MHNGLPCRHDRVKGFRLNELCRMNWQIGLERSPMNEKIHFNSVAGAKPITEGADACKPRLSVIFPFRDDPTLPHLMERIEEQLRLLPRNDGLEFIVVDSGSPEDSAIQVKAWCDTFGARYLCHGNEGEIFSIGAARDHGVQHATGSAVTFFDIDCRAPSDFWPRLLRFMESYGISSNKKAFFAVPCLYLTREGTEEFTDNLSDQTFQDFYLRWIYGDTASVQNLAPCTSIMVLDRLHYLSVGGHRGEFRGHGFEDFELYHRLMRDEDILPRPDNYLHDGRNWDIAAYSGFRAMFSLLGRAALMSNLFVVHLWHPRPKDASFYNAEAMTSNRALWKEFFKKFDKDGRHPDPLFANEQADNTTLYLGQPQSHASECIRDVQPLLGRMKFILEKEFLDETGEINEQDLQQTIETLGVTRILFHSPYGNSGRQKVYNWCRETGFPYLVFERGALPDSWFFDPTGFNADSKSYAESLWNFELTTEQRAKATQYIQETLNTKPSLETQGTRVGASALASSLKIGGKKVLFVPLQRPNDTVIKHMAGDSDGYNKFIAMIDEAAGRLRKMGWVVLCKKHPLETVSADMQNARYAPDDTHFLDLLELCDAVALINSGVGIYAMMMGKPTFVHGQSFYAFEGLNTSLRSYSADDLVKSVVERGPVDHEKTLRFVHHLITNVYSFATATTERREEADGSFSTITTGLDFYQINLPGVPKVTYQVARARQINQAAPLFDRFHYYLRQQAGMDQATAGMPIPPKKQKDDFAVVPVGKARRHLVPVIRPFVQVLGSKKDLKKYDADPTRFFANLKNPLHRAVGKVFFPPRAD
ncbi:glycosyltransferase [Ensifer sp. MPMI2T]|nr:glycosyltransferase [Ensifer sp. MPMI2T]